MADAERIDLDCIKLSLREEAAEVGDLRIWAETRGELAVLNLVSTIMGLAERVDVVAWPATWWQHFKMTWAPRWVLRRWPVRMERREFRIYKSVCPHIGARSRKPEDCYRYFSDPPGTTTG